MRTLETPGAFLQNYGHREDMKKVKEVSSCSCSCRLLLLLKYCTVPHVPTHCVSLSQRQHDGIEEGIISVCMYASSRCDSFVFMALTIECMVH